MKIFYDIKSVQKELKKHSASRIGFVPTMGALHEGHLSLIEKARENCSKENDLVVVSIFVNQKQFNNASDYNLYPKTLEQDIQKIENIVDIVFIPTTEEIYPDGFATTISVANITNNLCGKTRVGHFDGVALIVTKLFNIIKPHQAFFGEKDFQQLQLIKKLVKDLEIDVDVVGCKTMRQKDGNLKGLAMSSRNLRLNQKGQEIAPQIYQNLCLAKEQILANNPINLVLEKIAQNLLNAGFRQIDYLQVCDEENLQPVDIFNPNIKSRLFIAIYADQIRLIDNIELS
jgi:pantoate--beta-alanine ligase